MVCDIWHTQIYVVALCYNIDKLWLFLETTPIWPSRQKVDERMPNTFKWIYPGTRCIIDCTELPCFKPQVPHSSTFLLFKLKLSYYIQKEAATGRALYKGVLKNFAILLGKHLCWSLFLIMLQAFRPGLQHRCFRVNIAKFLRTPILKNICKQLLLCI